jgi:hypothetical protein
MPTSCLCRKPNWEKDVRIVAVAMLAGTSGSPGSCATARISRQWQPDPGGHFHAKSRGHLPLHADADDGLAYLKDFKDLKRLEIEKTQVTDKGVQDFEKARPDVKFVR